MIKFVSLISGSSGNSTFISDGKTNLLVDCGMSGIKLKNSLEQLDVSPDSIDGLLITHEHTDHVKGAGVVARKYGIPLYATEKTFCSMNIGKISDSCINIIQPNTEIEIGTIGVKPIPIPHDAADPVCFNLFLNNKNIMLATDIGHMTDDFLENMYGCEMLLIESNHDVDMLKMGGYPYVLKQRILSDVGHLSNDNAAKTIHKLIEKGTKHIMLGHLSKENNHPDIAYHTTSNFLRNNNVEIDKDLTLTVANRDTLTFCGGCV